jgi:hypothetical protein
MAVGYGDNGHQITLIESWNGTRWSVLPSPSPSARVNDLTSVSCASAAACMATGYYHRRDAALIESWNGTSWTVVPGPSPIRASGGILGSVSCPSANTCTAVRSYTADKTMIVSWNGTRWSVVPSPSRGRIDSLSGVSCPSANACTATGYYQTTSGTGVWALIESWNGTRWSMVPSPRAGAGSALDGVSCISATACTAAGDYGTRSGHKTLIESGTASG